MRPYVVTEAWKWGFLLTDLPVLFVLNVLKEVAFHMYGLLIVAYRRHVNRQNIDKLMNR